MCIFSRILNGLDKYSVNIFFQKYESKINKWYHINNSNSECMFLFWLSYLAFVWDIGFGWLMMVFLRVCFILDGFMVWMMICVPVLVWFMVNLSITKNNELWLKIVVFLMIENNDIFFISEHDERLTHFRNIVVGTLQPVSSSPADLSGK